MNPREHDPDRPWSDGEEVARVQGGAPPWRAIDRTPEPERDAMPDWYRTLSVDVRDDPAVPEWLRDAAAGALACVDDLRTEVVHPAPAVTDQPEPTPADPESWPEWMRTLDAYAAGGKASVTVVRPAVRQALDLLGGKFVNPPAGPDPDAVDPWGAAPPADPPAWYRTLAEFAEGDGRDGMLGEVESAATMALRIIDNARASGTELDTGPDTPELDHDARCALLAEYAEELATRFPDGPADAWSAGWLSAAGYLSVAEADVKGEAPPTDLDAPEPAVTGDYDRGWTDAVESAVGGHVWAGAPLAWRHVTAGDIVLTPPDDDMPAGTPWMVTTIGEAVRTFDWGVVAVSGDETGGNPVDPDGVVTVLLPAAHRAAIVAARTGLGATVTDPAPG